MTEQINKKSNIGFGLGCGRLSNADDNARKEGISIIHEALNDGITFLNTADFYGSGMSEMVLGKALKGYNRDKFYISVKYGSMVSPSGAMYGLDPDPNHIKNYLTYSLRRLNLDYIDLYQPGRIDLGIPIEETIGVLADLVKEGYIRHIGVSQVDAETLRKAHAVHPISYVELEYSLFNRSMETDILDTARELGIDVVAFGILAHGLLSGQWTRERIERGERPYNSFVELFKEDNIDKNVNLVENVRKLADEKQVTLSQLVHAWALTKGDDIIPLIGASKLTQYKETMQARNIHLSEEEIKRIEEAVPKNEIAGLSFPNMKFKNGVVVH